MQYLVLGPLEVRGDDGLVDLGGRRQRTVRARLLGARREAVSADRLIEDVWGGTPGPSALGVLQAYVSNLRRLLEPERAPRAPATVLRTKAPGYLLDVHTDADELGEALQAGMRLLKD